MQENSPTILKMVQNNKRRAQELCHRLGSVNDVISTCSEEGESGCGEPLNPDLVTVIMQTGDVLQAMELEISRLESVIGVAPAEFAMASDTQTAVKSAYRSK